VVCNDGYMARCLTACSEREEVGERLVGGWRADISDGPVLLGARSSVAAQLDVQVQGHRRRGAAASRAARVSQRLAARRSSAPVCIRYVGASITLRHVPR